MMKIALYGERCSGTNLMAALLERNLSCEVTHPVGFKHFPKPMDPRDYATVFRGMPVVFMIRHPVEWLRSLYVNPWHATDRVRSRPFREFVRHEWESCLAEEANVHPGDPSYGQPIPGDLNPLTGNCYANPVQLRNGKNQRFALMHDSVDRAAWVRLEDLVAGQEQVLMDLCRKFCIDSPGTFTPVLGYKGRETLKGKLARVTGLHRLVRRKFKRKPVVGERTRKFIWSQLDQDFEARFDYRP